jgi:hypothetical protein
VTDDNITLSLSIDNQTGGPLDRNLSICADQSVIDTARGLLPITGYFRPVGGGSAIMNPITFPLGRTILRLEVAGTSVKAKAANICDKRALNLPIKVLIDDPSVDSDPCHLDVRLLIDNVDDEHQLLGLRRRAGSADDDSAEAFFTVQFPDENAPGDSLNVRFRAIDMPRVAYAVTGFEVVGGEFGGSGLPGFDALELRAEDPVFTGSPDLAAIGLLRSYGAADGIGEVPLGPPPTTAVFDVADLAIPAADDPAFSHDLFALALLLPGERLVTTGIGVDTAPTDTILGDSSYTVSGFQAARPITGNVMLRLLLDGDRATLAGGGAPATMSPSAVLRSENYFIAIDRRGRRIE